MTQTGIRNGQKDESDFNSHSHVPLDYFANLGWVHFAIIKRCVFINLNAVSNLLLMLHYGIIKAWTVMKQKIKIKLTVIILQFYDFLFFLE